MEFLYRVSIIVPVYNAEQFLDDCIGSLLRQTIDKNTIEIILLNDGSVDNSAQICRKYSEKYSFIKYVEKENTGVSNTRNMGIKMASGKYILFLDSDDMLTPESVESLADFFDSVYDKVDMVTYFIQPYKDGKNLKPHARYKEILKATGIYDLEKTPYVIQTTMNICVKNMGESNMLFNENMKHQEDQEYINRILEKKLKIGYCSKATYLYNRNNDNSAVATKFHAYYLFEESMNYFESLFARYKDTVPKYYQAIFFHDLRWKLTNKILYPFHYSDEQFEKAMERIKKLLARVDVDIIVSNPSINKKHIHYWLNLKPNAYPTAYVTEDSMDIVVNGKTIEKGKQTTIRIVKIEQTDNGFFRVRGVIESSIYDYIDEEPEFYVIENESSKKRLEVFRSKYSYVATNIMTNKIYGFDYLLDPEKVKSISFSCTVDCFEHNVIVNFMEYAVFRHKIRLYNYARGRYIISFNSNIISFTKKTKKEIYEFEKAQIVLRGHNKEISRLKNNAIDHRYNNRIWLYSDMGTVLKDNGYYQFVHDFEKNDGVLRYYIYTRPIEEIEHLFTPEQIPFLVEYGSEIHKLLYLSAEMIFSSFFGRDSVSPFETNKEELDFYDIEHFRVIYMQHGVLHANYVNKYSSENAHCDKVLVSSNFEIENLTGKYSYREEDLIKCGMPRYEFINRNADSENRILLAPSWRSYFAKNVTANTYHISESFFRSCDYFVNFQSFINDKKLAQLLEEYNLILDVKMHPIVNNIVSGIFKTDNKRINFVNSDVNLENYKVFITDFSSFVFDYAFLNRPILYFVPDYIQFKSGMNLYRELDLPFDKAFGPMVTDPEKAVKELEKIFKNNFVPEEIYKKRMEEFYLPMGNCRHDIYEYVTSTMFGAR
ncbi:MAG: glycosyltransferase [Acutalibacteraceae bacterium]|nr:glycosyltransferase [Acutalibacteraceae bacterium]